MKKQIQPIAKPVSAHVLVPGSKSITNRALLLAALAKGTSHLSGMLCSDDTVTFAEALQGLGVNMHWDKSTQICTIEGCNGHFPKHAADVWCQDAGTAARFLLAACAAMPGEFHFDGSDKLRERPLLPLLRVLCQQGANVMPVNASGMPFTLMGTGALKGGEIDIPGDKSSQFLSGLLMIAPLAKSAMILRTANLVSEPYVKLTCKMMQDFGVEMQTGMEGMRYTVPVPQFYQAREYVIEPDLSTASYFFAVAALTGGEITVANVQRTTCQQGDVRFLEVLEKMGCKISDTAAGIKVQGCQQLQGIDVDMGDYSDTFMTLACIAPFANSPTTIRNIAHTRLQESDRIDAVAEGLQLLGIKVETGVDYIRIYPGIPRANTIKAHNDHRIAMSFTLIGLKVPGIIIDGAACVAKTCPNYFELIEQVSG